jgi:prolipoprotein diacylglyceryl transferase
VQPDLQIGSFSLHLYSLFFAVGLLAGGLFVNHYMQKLPVRQNYFFYAFFGIFIGARLFHCLFYDTHYYIAHPLEILLPIAFENGKAFFTGFNGLASHGGTLGLMAALAIFAKRNKVNYLQICDIFAVATPLAGGFIRLGNLMNSEIVGKPTSVDWAFIFPNVDLLPRHPAQLYEALWYFFLFFLAFFLFIRLKSRVKSGFFLFFCILGVAIFRFLIEFIKENQSPIEENMFYNIGQMLSVPFILAGFIFFFILLKKKV